MIARRAPIQRRVPLRPSQALIPRSGKVKRPGRFGRRRFGKAKQADFFWAQLVKLPGRCEECGSTLNIEAAHGFSRRYHGTRWLPINGFCLCHDCHARYTAAPKAWEARLRVLWGESVYETLWALALGPAKPDLAETVARLKEELRVRKGEAASSTAVA